MRKSAYATFCCGDCFVSATLSEIELHQKIRQNGELAEASHRAGEIPWELKRVLGESLEADILLKRRRK